MADIELVIKIPEDVRVAITRMGLLRIPDEMQKKVDRAIQRGIPLPKGHGRLIEDTFTTVTDIREDGSEFTYVPYEEIENALTIIEADKEDKE